MEKTSILTGDVITATPRFATNSTVILESTNLDEIYEISKSKILETFSMFQQLGSNWIFVSIKKMDISIIEYNPLKAKSYIPLDKKLAAKKAIINIQNEDNQCFKWCIARALNPTDNNPQRIDKDLITQAEKINWDKIEFPVSLKQITQFEKNNQDISVNVYGYESSVYPLRISKNNDRQHLIDVLLISDGETNHYCLINNLSRLLSSQTSKRNCATHYCRNCLLGFSSEESLSKHKLYCDTYDSVRIDLPKPGSIMYFKHYFKSMRVPFVIYADFESFIKPINTCTPNPNESYTKQYQKHIPSSFCYYIKCFDESIYKSSPVSYTAYSEDEDIAQIFVDSLKEDILEICNKVDFKKPMIFTSKNKKEFKAAIKCHICEKDLGKDRVRDHCHLTGYYRDAAHKDCNLKYRIPEFFPVLFHNLSGYDSHLFIKKLSGGKLSCIPNNEEKYISFSREIKVGEFINKEGKTMDIRREIRFLDSYRFMPSSLDALSKNLTKEQCKNIGEFYKGKQLDLLMKKGVYPYDWVDSIDKFNEAQLPPKESFFSKLNDEGINDDAYLHAQTLMSLKISYKLDPAWYYTSPGLAWDAALRKTKVELELLSDYDMILLIQKGIRGGISTISNRLGKSNNKYMDNYDETKPSKFIQYLDANNLYGWAMSKPLPTHGFNWMDEDELENWKSVPCILEVDLDYPDHLHDEHNDYPLAPERVKVGKVEKLIPNLNNKKNYVVHYTNLKLYERLGLKITKIHRGISFEESAWLSEYIELNTNLRTKATNEFEKDFFKLMNNSVFGKTMENIAKRVDVRLVTNRDEAVKLASRPNYEKGFYEDIKNDIENKFDTSEFVPNHPAINNGFKVGLNKKVLGMFKDEAGGKQIEEFVGLRSKLYSYKMNGKENKKCKGVKKNVVKNYITHNDYKDCLLNRKEHIRKMNIIRSHAHEVYTEEINKVALSAEDDKRVILEDGIHTLAYGHCNLINKPKIGDISEYEEINNDSCLYYSYNKATQILELRINYGKMEFEKNYCLKNVDILDFSYKILEQIKSHINLHLPELKEFFISPDYLDLLISLYGREYSLNVFLKEPENEIEPINNSDIDLLEEAIEEAKNLYENDYVEDDLAIDVLCIENINEFNSIENYCNNVINIIKLSK
ncbi:uncharacterized protein LOC136078605 [Hydra vulgaris]|uniref:Uncharacterized protein LOC136078605 n=1 Tax=Hydra vulgaris TaxID=6087 RepID=A0ABM4BN00_HYDVU